MKTVAASFPAADLEENMLTRRSFLLAAPAAALMPKIARAEARIPIPLISTSDVVMPDGRHIVAALNRYDPVIRYPHGAENPAHGPLLPGHIVVREPITGTAFLVRTARNAELFEQDPWRYIPKLGGYCAYSVWKDGSAHGLPNDANEFFVYGFGSILFAGPEGRRSMLKKQREDLDLGWVLEAQEHYLRLTGQIGTAPPLVASG